jgi:hypothetical protein
MAKRRKITRQINHRDALLIQDDMHSWVASSTGHSFFRYSTSRWLDRSLRDQRVRTQSLEEATANTLRLAAKKGVSTASPILATDEFASMMQTMAEQAPDEPLHSSDLLAPEGLIMFESPQTIDLHDVRVLENVRAISWGTQDADPKAGFSGPAFRVDIWCEAQAVPKRFQVPSPRPLAILIAMSTYWADGRILEGGMDIIRLLRAATALIRSPLASEERPGNQSRSAPRKRTEDGIRRIYLRHPEYALYEAEELDAARRGRSPIRAHWVRGHWRNHWYPTTEEHKTIWIMPHVKGASEVGAVQGDRLLIATA